MQNNKIVIFDFCETLVDFQTADAFVVYVCKHVDCSALRIRMKIYQIFNKSRVIDVLEILTNWKKSLHKKCCLWQIKGLKQDVLEQLSKNYYKEKIKPHLIEATNAILQKYREDGFSVVLVSGGYDIYLKHFASEYGVERLISSRLKFCNGKFTGRMDGRDCLNENKVFLLHQIYVGLEEGDILASYSDSITDIPILKIAKNAIVVSRNHQFWAEKYGFKEIIW